MNPIKPNTKVNNNQLFAGCEVRTHILIDLVQFQRHWMTYRVLEKDASVSVTFITQS